MCIRIRIFIGEYCFAYCTNLKLLKIPAGIQTLQGGFVAGCTQVEITFDPNAAFTAENHMIMKSDRTSIMQYYGWEEDATIVIPSQTQSILTGAFAASLIREVTFLSDNQLTTIKYDAFSSCSHLTTINLPHTIQQIEETAFQYCTSLEQVAIPEDVTSIENWTFGYCSALTEMTIPGSVTSIGDNAFYKCVSLNQVTIPESVTTFGKKCNTSSLLG